MLIAHPSCELYGTDRVLLESVDGFLARGWQVTVAVPVDGPLVAELERRGVDVLKFVTPVLRKSLMSPRGLLRLLKEGSTGTVRGLLAIRSVRPDVIYVNTITIPLWPLLGRITRRPVLTHVHEAEGSASRLLRTLLAAPLAFADTIVANSRYSAGIHAAAFPLIAGRAQIIYNGVPGPAAPAEPRRDITGPLRVLYVGRLSHRKGVDVVVDALAELQRRGVPAVLDIVGAVYPGYEAYEEALRASVERLGLGQSVTFHGFHADVTAFRENSDVAVVASRLDEPFGNTAVESILSARPLVVTDTSGLREAAEGYESALFVAPGDAAGLAHALQLVYKDWESYRDLAVADARRAEAKHGVGTYRRAIADAVHATAGRRK